jgi:lysophospholipase L1-like esterase
MKLLIKILLPVLVPILFFLLVELLLAGVNLVFPWDNLITRVGRTHSNFIAQVEFETPDDFLRDPDIFWVRQPLRGGNSGFHTNSRGFRGPEFTPQKPPDILRIICIGNSCTFGSWVENYSALYPSRLSTHLRDSNPGKKIEVINAGVEGYTIYQMLQYWRKIIKPLHPDIITIYAGINDVIYTPFKADKDIKISPVSCKLINYLLQFRSIHTLNAIVKRSVALLKSRELTTPYDEKTGLQRRVSEVDYSQILLQLIQEVRQEKIKIILITAPVNNEFPLHFNPYYEIIQKDQEHWVKWVSDEFVDPGWIRQLKKDQNYKAMLDQSLVQIDQKPRSAIPYFKAAFCYEMLDDTILASHYYHISDSLDVTRHVLNQYNQIMRSVAESQDVPLVDCAQFLDQNDNMELFVFDGFHPSEEGHGVIAEYLTAVVSEVIEDK